MRVAKEVEGYDYLTHRRTAMTPQGWRDKYPPSIYRRRVEEGETFYHRIGGRMVAEAYANIPEGKGS